MLSENGELILKNKEIANIFNDHFGSIVENLEFDRWDDHSLSPTKSSDRLKISSNGIRTTRALETSKQILIVFAYSLFSQFVWMMSRQLFKI